MASCDRKCWTGVPFDKKKIIKSLGKERLIAHLKEMLLIRNFETRCEAAYQMGKVGGFLHTYIGQEAIQTGIVAAIGKKNWWSTTYRCHALALLLGATPNEIMAELYGRTTGNAKGRGGSMHLYTDRLLGGFGIVGGQIPIATGAAFTIKYQGNKDEVSVCFIGDGAVAQGAFHESLNMASLWDLPCIYVIENNHWGMGTDVKRAIAADLLAEDKAGGYKMKGYTLDGTDFFAIYAAFETLGKEVRETGRPILIETYAERFRGHSISDPGLYRTKDALKEVMSHDPIQQFKETLINEKMLTEEQFKEFDQEAREIAIASMKFAEESPWPDPITLEEDVFAP